MLPEIEKLLVLQERDQKIRALKAELQTAPAEKDRITKTLASRTSAFENVRQRAKDNEVRRKKLELDAQSRRDSIAKYKAQQFQTRKNEEFQALGHEIERLEQEIVKIEDEEIELMERGDATYKEVTTAELEFKKAKAQAEQQTAALEKKHELLNQRLAETAAERQLQAGTIPEDLLEHYQRLFVSKDGLAVVPVEHEVCMGCHMKNTTTNVHRVKLALDIGHCELCGRILY
jgi:predicted  nucleic acid-binding Zn-ribbon protein